MKNIESIFEELEDSARDYDYVLEKITYCKNISIEMLEALKNVYLCYLSHDIVCNNTEIKNIIEKATGLKIEEVLK